MRRFHKFMSAAGLHIGNMNVESGVRGAKKAHNFCAQWIIASEASKYIAETKKNLIKMYNDKEYRDGDSIIDKGGQVWAKKEHFKEENDDVTLKWSDLKTYVEGLDFGRTNITDPANSGYDKDEDRLPVPSLSIGPSITNHRGGNAMDISSKRFANRKDSIIDVIALNFGLVRAGGTKEFWHFELTDLALSEKEKKIEKNKTYPELKQQ